MSFWHIAVIAICSGLLIRRGVQAMQPSGREFRSSSPDRVDSLESFRLDGFVEPAPRERHPSALPDSHSGCRQEALKAVESIRGEIELARQEINSAKIHARSLLINAHSEAREILTRAREECERVLELPLAPVGQAPSLSTEQRTRQREQGRRVGREEGYEHGRNAALDQVTRIFRDLEHMTEIEGVNRG